MTAPGDTYSPHYGSTTAVFELKAKSNDAFLCKRTMLDIKGILTEIPAPISLARDARLQRKLERLTLPTDQKPFQTMLDRRN